jgi:hypothetical protein
MRSNFDFVLALLIKFIFICLSNLIYRCHINNLVDCLEGSVGIGLWWLFIVGDFTLLPHEKQVFANIIYVGLATLHQFTGLKAKLVHKIFRISPSVNAENVHQVLLLSFV